MKRGSVQSAPFTRGIPLLLILLCLAPGQGLAGQAAGWPPAAATLLGACPGLEVKTFVPVGRGADPVDLTRSLPLTEGSWWNHHVLLFTGTGWIYLPAQYSISGTQDMGGGVIASGLLSPDGETKWLGWSSLGLLFFGEEGEDWSSTHRLPLYYMYNSMAVGSACSGSTIVDIFNEPSHTFWDTGNRALSHTLLGVADVSIPGMGDFLGCPIFLFETTYSEPGYFYYGKGLMVYAPDVGLIYSKMFEIESEGTVHWDLYISFLSGYHVE
ncbi:MAG: hypothetical protein AB1640_19595 [bacterium]